MYEGGAMFGRRRRDRRDERRESRQNGGNDMGMPVTGSSISPDLLLSADPIGAARDAPTNPLAMPLPPDDVIAAPNIGDLPPAPTPPWPINSGYDATMDAHRKSGMLGDYVNPYSF